MNAVAAAGSTPAANRNVATAALLKGRYELQSPVGQGGSGQVYRALDHAPHCHVAVKMLHELEASAKRSERFEREIGLQAGLAHASLIPVLDAGADGTRRYLVMPLIEGTTLAGRIVSGPLAERETRRIGAALAQALDCVHDHGIVHRDVKPSNVLLGRDGQVFLSVSPAAAVCPPPDAAGRFSLTGTAAYMAPEQVEFAAVDYPGDVYALVWCCSRHSPAYAPIREPCSSRRSHGCGANRRSRPHSAPNGRACSAR